MNVNRHRKKQAVYTSQQVRELDRIAIEQFGVPGYTLMTRAAQAAFAAIQRRWPEADSLGVLCGAGNNGGDGYVLARLAQAAGWQVCVLSVVDTGRLTGDAQRAYHDFVAAGGAVEGFAAETPSAPTVLPKCAVWVDALLGTGLQRQVTGRFAAAVQALNALKLQQEPAFDDYRATAIIPLDETATDTITTAIVALDIPSGLDADTGRIRGCAVHADLTVTFIALKQGLLTGQARACVGLLELNELELAAGVYAQQATDQVVIAVGDVKAALPSRIRCAHKGDYGHSLLIGGTVGMSGAIRLAGSAALRCGSGRVSLATHADHAAWLNLPQPELMVRAVHSATDLRPLLENKSALGIGPGLGQDPWAQQLLLLALDADLPLVIDADALNLLARMNRHQDNWILTPHPGEAASLLGCTTSAVEADRVQAVRALQHQYGGICVLKGSGTLIADQGSVAYCLAGNPGMASGGMGDVLTGMITALLAQGLNLTQAAQIGVQLHAAAADRAAVLVGERGLLASDVIAQLRHEVNP